MLWWTVAFAQEPVVPGDVVLQRSATRQAALVAAATGSDWTHAGLVSRDPDGALVVIEAVEPVRTVPLAAWVARSVDGRWAAYRPPIGTDLPAVDAAARAMIGRHYDLAFAWDDERIYCTELVRKAFAAAGVEAGELAPVSSFAVSDRVTRAALAERGIPLDRAVVSPQSIADDPEFTRVR